MFGRRKRKHSAVGSGQGAAMRAMVLGLTPDQVGLSPADGKRVWGVVMDSGMPGGSWHTLVVLAEGTTSLYTSAAFGVIGAGTHESVRRTSDRLLALTDQQLEWFSPDDDDTVPAPEVVAIRALTFDGRRVVVAAADDLRHGRHGASAVYVAAHEVITAIRLIAPDSSRYQ